MTPLPVYILPLLSPCPLWVRLAPYLPTGMAERVLALLLMILVMGGGWAVQRWAHARIRRHRHEQMGRLRQQQMMLQIEHERQEHELTRLHSEQLDQELRHKSSELNATAMNLIHKNDMLQSLDDDMQALAEAVAAREEGHEALTRRIAAIRRKISQNMSEDNNWSVVEENFNIIHDNFMHKLTEQYPQLKTADRRLCAYLRMGLSSKEMASMLNSSVRSIETARYRLRKKLDLGSGDNLIDFIQRI